RNLRKQAGLEEAEKEAQEEEKTQWAGALDRQENDEGNRAGEQRRGGGDQCEQVAHAEAVAEHAPRHLEQPVGEEETGPERAPLAVVEVQRGLQVGAEGGKGEALDVGHQREQTGAAQDHVADVRLPRAYGIGEEDLVAAHAAAVGVMGLAATWR